MCWWSFGLYHWFISVQSDHILQVSYVCLVYFVCREQKFKVKRCRSLKKVENHWDKPLVYSLSWVSVLSPFFIQWYPFLIKKPVAKNYVLHIVPSKFKDDFERTAIQRNGFKNTFLKKLFFSKLVLKERYSEIRPAPNIFISRNVVKTWKLISMKIISTF
jgi:hypothetical protein